VHNTSFPKRLLIQGATGSIGASTLSIVRAHREHFRVVGLAARSNASALLELAREFRPESLALANADRDLSFAESARQLGVSRVLVGGDAPTQQVAGEDCDLLVNAMSGNAGLDPTMAALERGLSVALANKETLVAAGPLVLSAAARTGARVLPIDSEHSAIFQCLLGEERGSIRRIWLTTSGGPFWGRSMADLQDETPEQALRHPTWKMGPKITVDSATLFNKGLEVIEAERLFGVLPQSIKVVVHRQSVVHSMVEFADGSFKAQLSVPDMRLPILYALTYPRRIPSDLVRSDTADLSTLTFEDVASGSYPCLDLAYDALARGGTAPAALSAADEIAVQAFLDHRIRFTDIAGVLSFVLTHYEDEALADLSVVHRADARARELATEEVIRLSGQTESKRCC